MTPITPEIFKEKMENLAKVHKGDEEYFHYKADELMIEVLKSLGYEDGVEIFEKQDKWYA